MPVRGQEVEEAACSANDAGPECYDMTMPGPEAEGAAPIAREHPCEFGPAGTIAPG